MLQRDYLLELVRRFGDGLREHLYPAVVDGDATSIREVEDDVGRLVDLDGASALALAPESLVTMMELSGVADSVAAHAAYALVRLADAYERAGDGATAQIRRGQARALAQAFGVALDQVPEEYVELDRQISGGLGEE